MFNLKIITSFLVLLRPEVISAHEGGRTCGTADLTEEDIIESKKVTAKWEKMSKKMSANVTIPTYFHVVNPSLNEITGTEATQIADLNTKFSGSGFSFNLVETLTYDNDDWWAIPGYEDPNEAVMKEETRKGGCEALNVYWLNLVGRLGYADYPKYCSDYLLEDAVVMLHTTGVGGSKEGFNEGDTLVHGTLHKIVHILLHVYFFVQNCPP